ncbi:MAG: hypothetical protein IKM02_06080 [Clostridia bacterium]|nr:hypothetical protein [Clostridia bacterium]
MGKGSLFHDTEIEAIGAGFNFVKSELWNHIQLKVRILPKSFGQDSMHKPGRAASGLSPRGSNWLLQLATRQGCHRALPGGSSWLPTLSGRYFQAWRLCA